MKRSGSLDQLQVILQSAGVTEDLVRKDRNAALNRVARELQGNQRLRRLWNCMRVPRSQAPRGLVIIGRH